MHILGMNLKELKINHITFLFANSVWLFAIEFGNELGLKAAFKCAYARVMTDKLCSSMTVMIWNRS